MVAITKKRGVLELNPINTMRTDWNKVAKWYGKHVQGSSTFQNTTIFPQTIALLQPSARQQVLDIACGEGSFALKLASAHHLTVVGFDSATQLITQAKQQLKQKHAQGVTFMVGDATHFPVAVTEQRYDAATCILALQNIGDYTRVFKETAAILKPGGKFVIVLNHPCFRPPKQSGWGFDDQRKLQYRRIDTYLSPYHVALDAHPGKRQSDSTVSFHEPLQHYISGLTKAGFMIDALEEWQSNRTSLPGARAKAENRSRQEFPLFMAIRARSLDVTWKIR